MRLLTRLSLKNLLLITKILISLIKNFNIKDLTYYTLQLLLNSEYNLSLSLIKLLNIINNIKD